MLIKFETVSGRHYNSQYSEAYIVYMSLGRYFADSVCFETGFEPITGVIDPGGKFDITVQDFAESV